MVFQYHKPNPINQMSWPPSYLYFDFAVKYSFKLKADSGVELRWCDLSLHKPHLLSSTTKSLRILLLNQSIWDLSCWVPCALCSTLHSSCSLFPFIGWGGCSSCNRILWSKVPKSQTSDQVRPVVWRSRGCRVCLQSEQIKRSQHGRPAVIFERRGWFSIGNTCQRDR